MKFNEIKNDNFFVIDSDNLEKIESKLYGFAIIESKIYFNEIPNHKNLDGTGSYIYINNNADNNLIEIHQDLNGNYGLCLFKKDNYFAISNSIIYLVESLQEKYELSLNYDYAKSYMSAEICSYIYEDTLVNEITVLPRNTIAYINTKNKEIYFEEINYRENTIPINSPEGINILDKWFIKWTTLIKNIKNETNNIITDLTGGLDSRAVFSLILNSNINLRDISISSNTAYKEDFEIASSISEYYNFLLNQPLNMSYNPMPDLETLLGISFYSKLGFSKAIWPVDKYPTQRVYNIVGYGGECIRHYIPSKVEENINFKANLAKKYSQDWIESTKKYVTKNYEKLNENIHNDNVTLVNLNYKETRSRYHFGKSVVERFLINQINLTPLIDPLLYKLNYNDENCNDNNLIMVLIYERYCNQLLNFKIEGGRQIPKSTIKYVKQICEKYPLNDEKLNNLTEPSSMRKSHPIHIKPTLNEYPITLNDAKNLFNNVFKSIAFKNHFKKYFPEEAYERIMLDLNKCYIGSMCDIFSVIGVFYIINNIEYSKKENYFNITSWLNNFLSIPKYDISNEKIMQLEKINKNLESQIEDNLKKIKELENGLKNTENKLKNTENSLKEQIKIKNEKISYLSNELDEKQTVINDLMNSNSWKITKPLRTTKNYFKK